MQVTPLVRATADRPGSGPLAGVRVVEIGGVGAVPFCCMLLADLGADVVRIERPTGSYDGGAPVDARYDLTRRNRRSVTVDLKTAEGARMVRRLVAEADVAIEGFRPGVVEKLGLGPEICLGDNPGLVYGRLTGWGQDGPRAGDAGHDLDYIALSGALHAIGPAGGDPVIPLNLVGDLGGGALYLAVGVLAALLSRWGNGVGQVVDAAMVDGSASLMTLFSGLIAAGYWEDRRGVNRLDSGAPWYQVYATADEKWVAVAANETRFWRNLLDLLGLDHDSLPAQHDREAWPEMRVRLADVFRTRTRDEWTRDAAGRDACVTPVLSLTEAPDDPHLRQRGTFVELDGIVQPAPAPRFSATPTSAPTPPGPGHDVDVVLRSWQDAARPLPERPAYVTT